LKEAAPQATPRTIKKVLRAIGYLSDPLTTAQIAKSTGINQTRLEPIIRDLFDSQLIDWDLDWPETKHRRGRPRQSKPSPSAEAKHLAAYLDDLRQTMEQTKTRRPANSWKEFERGMQRPLFQLEKEIRPPFYRTERGQEWLNLYDKHPNWKKRLQRIQDAHRLSRRPKYEPPGSKKTPNQLFEEWLEQTFFPD